ncbi:MAG: sensor histidine kinase [Candidatus Dormibacteria bacterium]
MTWRPSIRVRLAAAATLTAVAALLLVSVVANFLVEKALVGDIDSRISTRTNAVVAELSESVTNEIAAEATDPEYREPLLVWHFSAAEVPMAVGDLGPSASLTLPASVRRAPGSATVSIGGTRFRVRTAHLKDGGTAVVGATMASVDHATAALRIVEALLILPLCMLVFLGAYLLARAALRPVERLRLTAEQVGADPSPPAFSTGKPFDEVGRLAATFDHMVDRLDRVRRRQDQVTADASHELRTPLAAIEAEATLALRHERSGDEYRDSLGLVVDESRRMRSVLDGLLWLARADQGVSAPPAEVQDLAAVARVAVRRFEPIVEARGQVLNVDIPDVAAPVSAPEHWLERLLDALLDNACKYAPAAGRVGLSLAVQVGATVLSVSDDGPGIPAGERARLLRRFERGDRATSGSGLGLAIAQTVARATGAELLIDESAAGGAVVRVVWPSAG